MARRFAYLGQPSFGSEVDCRRAQAVGKLAIDEIWPAAIAVRAGGSWFDFSVRRRYNVSALAGAPGLPELGGGASGKPTRRIEWVST